MDELIPADGQYDKVLLDLETYFDIPGAKDLYDNFRDFQDSPVFAEACDIHKLAMASAIEGVILGKSKLNFEQLNKQLFHPDFIVDDTATHDACSERHVKVYEPRAKEIYENLAETNFIAITSGMFSGKTTLTLLTRRLFIEDGYEMIDLVAGRMPEAFIHSRALDEKIPAKKFVKVLPKEEDLKNGETIDDYMSIEQLITILDSRPGKNGVLLSEFSFLDRALFYEFSERISNLNLNREFLIKVISEGLNSSFSDAPIIDRAKMREFGYKMEGCHSFAPNQLDWTKKPVAEQVQELNPEGEKTVRYFVYVNKHGERRHVMDFSILNVIVSKYCDWAAYNPARADESVGAILGHTPVLLNVIQTAWEGDDHKRDSLTVKANSPENLVLPEA